MTTESKTTHKGVKVMLAHRYTLVRQSIADMLNEAGFAVVADVEPEGDLVRLATKYNPDILLLAWDLPKVPADIVRRLATEKRFTGVVVLAGPPQSSEAAMEAILAGARGYLSMNLPGPEFVSRLQFLARGDFVVSQDMAFSLGQQVGTAVRAAEATDGLSDRERQVLVLVATGATNKEIAQELTVTENTVKVHLRHILDKLDLRNRQQAAAYAVREGITEIEDIEDDEYQDLEDQPYRTDAVK